jgi:hypothetical protein
MFIKVSTRENLIGDPVRVFLQNLEPQFVTEFDADERGYLTYVRIDIPRTRREGDKVKAYMHTEAWNKEEYRLWEHDKAAETELAQLGTPKEQRPLSDFGIDFVPVVWQAFRNIGDTRGLAAITPAIDKIDEANRQATRLHQMLFRYNRALWALAANASDAQGRPLPPPRLGDSNADNTIEMDDDTIVRLPGMSTLASLVPALNYEAALSVIDAQMDEIERDLPELAYSNMRKKEMSGVAIEMVLGDTIDRLLEARGNAETALVRADQMALTIGIASGIFDPALGTYEAGAFDHIFADRPVLTTSEGERSAQVKVWVEAGLPLRAALKRVGFSDDEVADVDNDAAAEQVQQATFADAVLSQAQRQFDRGEPV